MAVVNPPGFLQNVGATHTAEQTRDWFANLISGTAGSGSLLPRQGVNPDLGFELVVQQSGTPGMSVVVRAGMAVIAGTEGSKQGVYSVLNDADVTLTIAAAHATLNRIDSVIFKVEDQQYSGSNNTSSLVVVTGTPAASPSPPTLPANCIELAQVSVVALDTAITNAEITDKRRYFAATGGIIKVTSATRPTNVNQGQHIYETDTGYTKSINANGTWVGANTLGIIARGNRTTDKVASGSEVGVLRLDNIPVIAGRAYRIMTSGLSIRMTTSGDTGQANIRISTSGAATTASTLQTQNDANANSAFAPWQSTVLSVGYYPGSDATLSVLLSLFRSGGAGNVTMSATANRPIELYVIDEGIAPADTGVDI